MRLSRLAIAACGVLVLAVAGCSPKPSLGAGPGSSPAPATTSSVPTIPNPLNTSKIESDPCSGLTAAQLAPYIGALSDTKKGASNNGPLCDFHPTDTHFPSVHLNVFPKLGGVSGLYGTGGSFPFFEKAGTVGGYPATHMAQGKNGPQEGECETDVAVSDMVVFGVNVSTTTESWAHYKDTCTVSDQLVTAVINNLKSGGGS